MYMYTYTHTYVYVYTYTYIYIYKTSNKQIKKPPSGTTKNGGPPPSTKLIAMQSIYIRKNTCSLHREQRLEVL